MCHMIIVNPQFQKPYRNQIEHEQIKVNLSKHGAMEHSESLQVWTSIVKKTKRLGFFYFVPDHVSL